MKVDASSSKSNECTLAQINAAQNDTGCPKTAKIATGYINAQLGAATDPTAAGSACDPVLDVWNGGPGKLTFFFVETGSHQCLGGALHTGQVPPWQATYKQAGANLDVTIPVPNTVDYPLGTSGGEVGSLSKEYLNWQSQKVDGTYDITSTACTGKRNYTFGFQASAIGSTTNEAGAVKGSASCG